ncbi:HupE/UreJ family protein [Steroidobacter sp. S1-65]|uniref:HupE/UreJ family protein n=1 Tax=Steroidobacter gossypii TaxID=2805490 RepID=A0ABS1X004_9GAMM|nr:HupE/UreJ family protein [Steroidobacter gossypii]MBM0106568.1 HupE/UreJ family protein [Steroidobacter gossypii]
MSRQFTILLLLLATAMAHVACARAQSGHESSLSLHVERASVRGEWQVPLLDLDAALTLDSDRDGRIAWPEIEHRRAEIEEYLDANLRILADGVKPGMRFEKLSFGARQGEPFVLSEFSAVAQDDVESLDVDYTLLFEHRPEHRAVVKVIWQGLGSQRALIAAPGGANLFSRADAGRTPWVELLKSGVWHIWIGYDHILFLLVLLIPAVLRRTTHGREAATDFSGPFLRVVAIVSAFTVAHSITLSCAALGWIVLPSRLVESAIAASVVVAALVNLLPRTAGASGVWIASGFGLLHGFGFANVLSEIDAEGEPAWRTLLGFNLGVEIGQLAIVAVFLPIAYLLRTTRFYRTGVVYGGSSLAAVCAMFWLWQRAL